jgi:cytoskeletal protein CcmA (bactofilin family)
MVARAFCQTDRDEQMRCCSAKNIQHGVRNMPYRQCTRHLTLRLLAGVLLLASGVTTPVLAQVSFASRNIYAAGATVRTSAPIEGDFLAVGGKVVVDQPVKGDVTLAGGSIDVRAPVGDDVRAAGGDVSMESTIGGELFATAGTLAITKTAHISNGASLFGGAITIDGKIDGPLRVDAQKVTLNGEVTGDARLTAADIELGPNARITGTLRYSGPDDIRRAEGAEIGGAITRGERESAMAERSNRGPGREWNRHMEFGGPPWMAWGPVFFALLACSAVFLLVFPGFSQRAADTVKDAPGLALVLGFAAVLGVPTLAGLLFITLLGIPLAIAVLALFPALLLMGYVVGILFISRRVQVAMRMESPGSLGVRLGFFALVLVLILLTGSLPFVGPLVMACITLFGLGACLLVISHRGAPAETQSNNLA